MKKRTVRKGFTLVELLIVIAVISLLAAILFPVFNRARENARRSSCLSNQKQIGLAFLQYVQDYDERIPNRALGNINLQDSDMLQPYLKSLQVFACPSQTTVTDSSGVDIAQRPNGVNAVSYAYSFKLADTATPNHLAAIPEISRTTLICDIRGSVDRSAPLNYLNSTGGNRRFEPAMRHLDGAGMTFLDGHVKWFEKTNRGLTCATTGNLNGTWWWPTASSP